MASAGRRWPTSGRGAQPAWTVGAHGHDTLWARPALFAQPDYAAVAPYLVHPDRLARGALCTADTPRLVLALGGGLGTHRRHAVGAVRRRAYCRSDQAGLSRHPGAARKAPTRSGAAARAGALARGRRDAVMAGPLVTQETDPRPAARPDVPRWHRASVSHWDNFAGRCR